VDDDVLAGDRALHASSLMHRECRRTVRTGTTRPLPARRHESGRAPPGTSRTYRPYPELPTDVPPLLGARAQLGCARPERKTAHAASDPATRIPDRAQDPRLSLALRTGGRMAARGRGSGPSPKALSLTAASPPPHAALEVRERQLEGDRTGAAPPPRRPEPVEGRTGPHPCHAGGGGLCPPTGRGRRPSH
jgi:hypothetical protein